jgi:chromatin remodeling complex protein RSC6
LCNNNLKIDKYTSNKMAPKKSTSASSAQSTATQPAAPAPEVEQELEEIDDTETDHQDEQEHTEETGDKKTRARRVVSKESFFQSLQELAQQVDAEIEKLTKASEGSEEKPKSLRFIKRVRKALGVVESDARKVLKVKNNKKKSSSASGFMKPVFISSEMASFTNLDKNTPYPRPQITSAICKYIESHQLQNPKDRREFTVDAPLQRLLRYDPQNPPTDEAGNAIPMTYFRLQKYMQHHFRAEADNTPAPVASQPATPAASTVAKKKTASK